MLDEEQFEGNTYCSKQEEKNTEGLDASEVDWLVFNFTALEQIDGQRISRIEANELPEDIFSCV